MEKPIIAVLGGHHSAGHDQYDCVDHVYCERIVEAGALPILLPAAEDDSALDRYWIAAVRMAKSMGLPMLGICRGTQLTNVALGGSLCQDISLFCEHPLLHTQRHSADAPLHQVALQSGSRLSCLFGAETVFTNSTHHQCVDMPAPGLKITARTSDGVPEGLESDDGQVVLVQWHPETLCRTDARMLRLFEDLVGRARAYSDAHPMR